MIRYLGYVAIALSSNATTNRACRLRNATTERLRELIRLNLQGLHEVLQFNLRNGIYLYRISSQIIPFATHPVNRIPWWDEFAGQFAVLAELIYRNGFRVSMHPGQFTVLNSSKSEVVATSIRELEWHTKFLECLQTDATSKIVVHAGGAYGEKAQAADRFVEVVKGLPEDLRRRLVIENNERDFDVEDMLDMSERIGVPVVFDWLHHKINPGSPSDASSLIDRCFDTWHKSDGLPKVHFSSQAQDGRPGQHADWIDVDEFVKFLDAVPKRSFDCMLEAKHKELALFRLRSNLKARGIVEAKAA